jgi:hypothetical protein
MRISTMTDQKIENPWGKYGAFYHGHLGHLSLGDPAADHVDP